MADLAYRTLDFFRILFGYDSYCPDSAKARGEQQFLWWVCFVVVVFFFHLMHFLLPNFLLIVLFIAFSALTQS